MCRVADDKPSRPEQRARDALLEIPGQFHSGEVHENTVAAMLAIAREFAADAIEYALYGKLLENRTVTHASPRPSQPPRKEHHERPQESEGTHQDAHDSNR